MENPKLVAIVGETASGKSAIALALAKKYKGEIIAADSWTIYKGFDVGTAKPSPVEQQLVPHHLIDVADAHENFTARLFKDLATHAVEQISERRHIPIMVGGTGLYIDSVLFDYSFLPPAHKSTREHLQSKSIQELITEINERGYDLSDIDTRNKRRLIRLLETKGARPQKSSLRPNTLIIGVKISRAQLRENIERRVKTMFRRGLRREVEMLANKYGWDNEAMKGIGYAEFQAYFAGSQSLGATKRKIVKNTLNLAKRQRTWFKRNTSIVWVENLPEADALVSTFINSRASV
jgi:tRNA dimethylallyltransferase